MTTFEVLRNKRAVLAIAQKHGVTSIRVLGSIVRGDRGDDSADSDVDFLVTTGSEVSARFPAGLILKLENLLSRRVDIVTESGVNSHIRDEVLSEAVPL